MKRAAVTFFCLLLVYAVFSYSLTDPNLVITSWAPYWQFQQWMWQTFFSNAQVLTTAYAVIILALFATYIWLCWNLRQAKKIPTWWWYLAVISPLFLAYNALSHDVFNYMFNAKMVLIYQSNPHTNVALDFPNDAWLRFMHNTHTTAPYGYGWTAISLLPSILGMGKFLLTWLAFRMMSVVSIGLLWLVYQLYTRWSGHRISIFNLALVFLNPLFLLEVIANQHNDLWMMVPAVLSLILLVRRPLKPGWIALSGLLLLVSISTKLASVALLPLWLIMAAAAWRPVAHSLLTLLTKYWPLIASMLMFLPLLTTRSQQFHPWYLVWVLVWLPLFQNHADLKKWRWLGWLQTLWKYSILMLSFSSLLRYLPWLWVGNFEGSVLLQQKLTTWIPFIVTVVVLGLWLVTKTPVVGRRGH